MKKNTLQLRDEMNVLIHRNMELIKLCKTEQRELTEEEEKEFTENEEKVKKDEEELKSLEEELKNEPSNEEGEGNKTEKEKKSLNNPMKTQNFSIVKEIRTSMENGSYKFSINTRDAEAQAPVAAVAGYNDGEKDHKTGVVETETKSILEPLYAESVLNKIGATIYSGLPMGDITVPVMSKNTVGWLGELATAAKTANDFSSVTLKPKRLSAQIEISKMLIAQDTVGVEAAIRRDIVKALQDKFESTIFSADAKTDVKPAGLFAGAEKARVATFANVCDIEAGVEEKNATGQMMYIMNPKVKAFLRQLAKSTKTTELVYQNGEVDGTPAISSSLIPTKTFAYGNFQDFIVGFWDNVDVTVDPYTTAANGTIRLIVNMYADAVLARTEAIAFGDIA